MKARSLPELNACIALAESQLADMRKKDLRLSPVFLATVERLRKAREEKRIFAYRAKSFTPNGHVVRH